MYAVGFLFYPKGGEPRANGARNDTRVNANLDRLRQRRQELLQERELEPSFEKRYKLTCRVDRINRIIESTSAALHAMQEYVR